MMRYSSASTAPVLLAVPAHLQAMEPGAKEGAGTGVPPTPPLPCPPPSPCLPPAGWRTALAA
eukprot:1928431-Pleurochrysis_carterae.AAC.1